MYDMHRHFCVRYAYYPLWYAYRLCLICIHIYCMHIVCVRYAYQVLSALVRISDMDDCPLYKYCLCLICVLPALVCILSVSDMRTTCSGAHIGHRRYAYAYCPCPICVPEQVVCISSMSDMRTINVYAYRTRTICIPPALVCILSMSDMCTH